MRSWSQALKGLIATVVVRAHHVAICPELMRDAEISAAGQTACLVCSPLSERCLHRTRPTGQAHPLELRDGLDVVIDY
jgi:hypothetical protein